jgi:hypothetical protein
MRALVAVTLAALAAACAAAPEGQSPTASPPPMMTMNRDLKSMTEAALEDAVRRTGLGRPQLRVISAEAVTWADGSIGCPQPGVYYTQALVPGYRIRIEAGREVLDYHAGRRGQLILCPPGRSVEPSPGGPT